MDRIEELKKDIEKIEIMLEPVMQEYGKKYKEWLKLSDIKAKLVNDKKAKQDLIWELENPKVEITDDLLFYGLDEIKKIINEKYKKDNYIYETCGYFDEFSDTQINFALNHLFRTGVITKRFWYCCNNCGTHVEEIPKVLENSYFELGSCHECESEEGFHIEELYRKL